MTDLALHDPAHLVQAAPGSPEQAYGELQLVRRRLEAVNVELMRYCREKEASSGWERTAQAADAALRAVQAAIAAAPDLPFDDAPPDAPDFAVDDLTVSLSERRVWWVAREVPLTATELKLLVALARQPRRVFTKAELLRDVWGYRSLGRTRTVDSFASRLRRKLQTAGAPDGRYVVCLWGVGYSLMRP
jgi:DNA-binding response OmpR family regulator